jgi:hypothetical protein
MKKLAFSWILLCIGTCFSSLAQQGRKDSIDFFRDDSAISFRLTTDYRKLRASTKINEFQPATVTGRFADTTLVSEEIRLCARGQYRRENCYIPSILLDFKNSTSPKLSWLGKLKLVSACANASYNEQLLLKEFLVYKMYNLITSKSFRVRLLKITYDDTKNRIKLFTQYAFLIEDEKDVAKRNKCRPYKIKRISTENTNRDQMTLVSIFQYMIGNTDWAVGNSHNIRLIQLKKDSLSRPFAIPYDFDYCGLVDANYAIPDEALGTASVTERVYRGYVRSVEELHTALAIFRQQKDSIYRLINDFSLLESRNREKMIAYLDDFYHMIDLDREVKSVFIDNARRQ